MNIAVLLKKVPDSDSLIVVADDNVSVLTDDITFIANESDTYALEEALLLKEKHGGSVFVYSMGDEGCEQILKDALAKGADKGFHFFDEAFDSMDALARARVFAEKMKEDEIDLVLTGLQSDDEGNAQTGLAIAEFLGTSHASMVVGTELDGDLLKVKRELEGGWFQWTELDMPAVLTIQSGLNKPRYASLRGIMMVKKKPMKKITMADLDVSVENTEEIRKIYIPEKVKETHFIEGSPSEIVSELLDTLANKIKVI